EVDVAAEVGGADRARAQLQLDAEQLGALAQALELGGIELLDPRVIADLEHLAAQVRGAVDRAGQVQRREVAVAGLPEQRVAADPDLHAVVTPLWSAGPCGASGDALRCWRKGTHRTAKWSTG